MEALILKADAAQPLHRKRKSSHPATSKGSKQQKGSNFDKTLNSVAKHTSIPKSLKDIVQIPENVPNHKHIVNKKLRTHLNRQSVQGARAKALLEDAEMLLVGDAGGIQVEGEMERTWKVGQSEVIQSSGQEAAKGRNEYKLDGGPYRSRYTRNGR
jgi:U3 small nucleolar RNA-associated protein 7